MPQTLPLAIAVFIFYLLLFSYLVCRVPFFTHSGLTRPQLVLLFILKVLAGVAYGVFYSSQAYRSISDTWRIDEVSKSETALLLHDPIAFIKDLFSYGYAQSGNLFAGKNSYWNDLKLNIIIKTDAVLNLFTFGNYYANLIFFNFLFFFGPVAFFRAMSCIYPQKKWLLICSVFLVPSFLFWCSGLHKEGLIFTCLGLIIYHFQQQLQLHKLQLKPLLVFVASWILLFALRNFMALLLLPALAIWQLAYLYPSKAVRVAVTVYAAGLLLFFTSAFISPVADFPQYIIDKQSAFKALPGNSVIEVPGLHNSLSSFIHFLPYALDIAFLRPHITEARNFSYLPAATEVLLLLLIVVLSLFYSRNQKQSATQTSFTLFSVCFGISFLLLSGYTVTFSGAIVRYRALVLPLLITPLIQYLPVFKKNSSTHKG